MIAKSGLAQSLYQQQMDDNTFEKWYMATVEGIVEADEDSLVLPMDRSTDGIHYEVNPKGKETRTDFSVLCRHSSQPVDNSVHKLVKSVDIAQENVDIELQNVDKSGQNVDKSVYNSPKCGYTEVLSPFVHRKNTSNSSSFQPYRSPSRRGYLIWCTTNGAAIPIAGPKGCIYTHAHRRAYYGYRIITSNYFNSYH